MIDLEVAVTAPIAQTLTYRLAASNIKGATDSSSTNYVGRRVLVPLGQRKITGYVLSQSPGADDKTYTIRQIARFLDKLPLFHDNIIPFFRWVATYYHYPIGLVIKSALPGGLAPKSRKKIILKKHSSALLDISDPIQLKWVEKLVLKEELNPAESAELLADATARKVVESFVERGCLAIESELQADGVKEKKELCYAPVSVDYQPLEGHDDSREQLKAYQLLIKQKSGSDIKFSEAKALYYLFSLFNLHQKNPVAIKEVRKFYQGAS
ncbi:MAG: hypothetical protein ACN4GW_16985, partial [Desulforhopalus sp.]